MGPPSRSGLAGVYPVCRGVFGVDAFDACVCVGGKLGVSLVFGWLSVACVCHDGVSGKLDICW